MKLHAPHALTLAAFLAGAGFNWLPVPMVGADEIGRSRGARSLWPCLLQGCTRNSIAFDKLVVLLVLSGSRYQS